MLHGTALLRREPLSSGRGAVDDSLVWKAKAWLRLVSLSVALGCAPQPVDVGLVVGVPAPATGALRASLPMSGEVRVSSWDGRLLASAKLDATAPTVAARFPRLTTEEDLLVQVRWWADGRMVAEMESPMRLRLSVDDTTRLHIDVSELRYPDDDGDGAPNLHELFFAARKGSASIVDDPTEVPPGFVTDVVDLLPYTDEMGSPVRNTVRDIGLTNTDFVALFVNRPTSGATPASTAAWVSVTNLATRAASRVAIPCESDSGPSMAVDPTGASRAAVVCNRELYLVVWDESSSPSATVVELPGRDNALLFVSYSDDGSEVLVSTFVQHWLLVLDAATGALKERIGPSMLGVGAQVLRPTDVPQLGLVLLPDWRRQGIVVLRRNAVGGLNLAGYALEGQLPNPRSVVVDPTGKWAYVADALDARLTVVALGDTPSDWRIMGEIEIPGPVLGQLVFAPPDRSWLYAAAGGDLLRIDPLTHSVVWREPMGRLREPPELFVGTAFSPDGRRAAVTDGLGLILLGPPSSVAQEQEPNHAPSHFVEGRGNAVGPPPAVALGSAADQFEHGALEYDSFAGVSDFDDLWQLRSGSGNQPLIVALRPTSWIPVTPALGLLTSAGELLDLAATYTYEPFLQNGVFLITDPANQLPEGALLGVSFSDRPIGDQRAHYAIIIRELDETIAVSEVESNDDPTVGQDLAGAVRSIRGSRRVLRLTGVTDPSPWAADVDWVNTDADSPEWLAGLGRDCFLVPVWSELAVRMDPGPSIDPAVQLASADDGAELPWPLAWRGDGVTEYVWFDKRFFPEEEVTLCVVSDMEKTGPYTLTFVDFSDYWRPAGTQ